MDELPTNEAFHNDDVIFLQHRHQSILQFALPEFLFVEPGFYRLTSSQIGKTTHKKESIGILDGEGRTQYFHADLGVRGHGSGAKYLEEVSASAGLGFVGTHFDDHLQSPTLHL